MNDFRRVIRFLAKFRPRLGFFAEIQLFTLFSFRFRRLLLIQVILISSLSIMVILQVNLNKPLGFSFRLRLLCLLKFLSTMVQEFFHSFQVMTLQGFFLSQRNHPVLPFNLIPPSGQFSKVVVSVGFILFKVKTTSSTTCNTNFV